jgi:hypothetical protein
MPPPSPPSLLAQMDERQRLDGAIERLVYTLLRPALMPFRHLSGYVSRERQRAGRDR